MMNYDTSARGLRWISRRRVPAEINPYGLGLRFPSPRPSPLGKYVFSAPTTICVGARPSGRCKFE